MAVTLSDLVSYWSLEEASGTRVDAHGSNDLTDNNTVTQDTGIQGNSASLDEANSEYLDIGDGPQSGLDITGDLTICCWVKPASTGTQHQILTKWESGSEQAYNLYIRSNDTVRFFSDDGTTARSVTGNTFGALSAGTWYFLCARVDTGSTEQNLTINSTEDTATGPASINNCAADFRIGAEGPTPHYFDGLIDEVSIWNGLMSDAQVAQLYNSGSGLTYAQTVALFDQPDLEIASANDVGDAVTYPTGWNWEVTISNTDTGDATFTDTEVIATIALPSSGVTHGSPSAGSFTDITNSGNIDVSRSGDTVTVSASGGSVTIGASTGSFVVTCPETPTAGGTVTLTGSGVEVDPNNEVAEADETNNTASNTSVVVDVSGTTIWKFDVDWNNDRDFGDSNEACFADVVELSFSLGHRNGPYGLVAESSELNAILKSYDGKYNPENSSSVLAGSMLPGRLVRVQANGTTIWQGFLQDIETPWEMMGTYTGKTLANLRAQGFTKRLQEIQANFALQQNERADTVIERIVTQIGPPAAVVDASLIVGSSDKGVLGTNLVGRVSDYFESDRGIYTFANYGDVTGADKQNLDSGGFLDQNALRRIRDLTEADLGRFWPSQRSGKVLWYNREHFPTNLTVAGTIDDSGSNGEMPIAVDYRYGKDIVNEVAVTSYERTASSTATLWQGTVTAPAHSQGIIEAKYTGGQAQRVGATNVTVAATGGSASIKDFGDYGEITLDNRGGTASSSLLVTVTGTTSESDNEYTIRRRDINSISTYGRQQARTLNLRPQIDQDEAEILADYIFELQRDPRGIVNSATFRRDPDNAANAEGLTWTIGDKVRVILGNGHDHHHHIIGEEHLIRSKADGHTAHQYTYYLEPAYPTWLGFHDMRYAGTAPTEFLGTASSYTRVGQSFTAPASGSIGKVRFGLRPVGSFAGTLTSKLYTYSGGTPVAIVANGTSDAVVFGNFENKNQYIDFSFATAPAITAGSAYFIDLTGGTALDGSNYIEVLTDTIRQPLYAGLVAAYTFDDDTDIGNDDFSTNDLTENGTPVSHLSKDGGELGRCVYFDGTNEYYDIADNAALSLEGDMCIELWCRPDDLDGTFQMLASKFDGGTDNSYELRVHTTDVMQFIISYDGSNSVNVLASTHGTLTSHTWIHVLAYHEDGVGLGICINNGTVDTQATGLGIYDGAAEFALGARGAGTFPFKGQLDEVRIYNFVPTAAQRSFLYNSGKGRRLSDITHGNAQPGEAKANDGSWDTLNADMIFQLVEDF